MSQMIRYKVLSSVCAHVCVWEDAFKSIYGFFKILYTYTLGPFMMCWLLVWYLCWKSFFTLLFLLLYFFFSYSHCITISNRNFHHRPSFYDLTFLLSILSFHWFCWPFIFIYCHWEQFSDGLVRAHCWLLSFFQLVLVIGVALITVIYRMACVPANPTSLAPTVTAVL